MYKLSDIFKTDNIEQKRKILSNFPITREDRNKTLVGSMNTSNGGGGSVSKYAPRYFKIDWDKASKDWRYVFNSGYDGKESIFLALRIASTMKSNLELETIETAITASQGYEPYAFSYNVLYIPNNIKNNFGINYNFCSFEQIIEVVNNLSVTLGSPINLSMDGITEITEDEYYKID